MKNIKIHITLIALLFIALGVQAQQDPMYTQYMNNPLLVNPAFAGANEVGTLSGVFRKQWVGIEGAPTTSSITYNTPVEDKNYALGSNLLYDEIGPVQQVGLYIDYAYRIDFEEKGKLSFGLKGGMNSYHFSAQTLRMLDPSDEAIMAIDESHFLPNFGVGVFYYNEKVFAGISVPKLIRNNMDSNDRVTSVDYLNREEWHWFISGGYVVEMTKDIDFRPSITARYAVGAPLSLEGTALLILQDKVWVGVMFRFGDAVGGIAKWQVSDKFNVGYSYDYNYSALRHVNKGSHEIFMSYYFLKEGKFANKLF